MHSNVTREAMEAVQAPGPAQAMDLLPARLGISYEQMEMIMRGEIRPCPCGCKEPVWRIEGGWSTPEKTMREALIAVAKRAPAIIGRISSTRSMTP